MAAPSEEAARGPTREDVATALRRIEFPNKYEFQKLSERLGNYALKTRYSLKTERSDRWQFLKRGGISSPYMQYVSDIDIILNDPTPGGVSLADVDRLIDLCVRSQTKGFEGRGAVGPVVSALVVAGQEARLDIDVKTEADLDEVSFHAASPSDAVVISTLFNYRDWWIGVDWSIRRGPHNMDLWTRMNKIRGNIQNKDYAKVVQRMRTLLASSTKKEFSNTWNMKGGALRFLAKQLDVVSRLDEETRRSYMLKKLCLPGNHSPQAWKEVVEAEMQEIAFDLLLKTEKAVMMHPFDGAEWMYSELKKAAAGGEVHEDAQEPDEVPEMVSAVKVPVRAAARSAFDPAPRRPAGARAALVRGSAPALLRRRATAVRASWVACVLAAGAGVQRFRGWAPSEAPPPLPLRAPPARGRGRARPGPFLTAAARVGRWG